MSTQVKQGIFLGAALIILVGIAGAAAYYSNRPSPATPASQDFTVAASIFPIADIARHVAGDNANVIQLLPSGASEHSYALTPQQLASLQEAHILFVIGHNLDTWATGGARRATAIPTVAVDQGINLKHYEEAHEHEEEEDREEEAIDPHYWLTVPNAQKIAATIAATLQDIDPANREAYQANLASYQAELAVLEAELQAKASAAPSKEFIAIHNAWSYLADHYGFELVATYEPVEGQAPSIADLQALKAVVAEHNLTVFYTEPQKQSTSGIRFLEQELDLTVRVLDPLGGPPPHDSYINLMRANIESLTAR